MPSPLMPTSLASLLEPRRVALLLALVSAVGLAGALILQFGFGEIPCQLCIWQRWPHVLVVALGVLGWFWQPRAMVALAALTLAAGALLAGYHAGVEQGLWAAPTTCAAAGPATSVEELRQMLQNAPPACDQVSVTLVGLSLAAWNGIASTGLALLAAAAVLRGPEKAPR